VSKSFLSAVVGVALELGYLDSLDQPMMDFFPEYDTPGLDPRKRDITIRHLISMHAGFAGDTEVYSQVYASTNWVRTAIELPLISNPGQSFAYNTFVTHILSAVLTKATGMSTLAFTRQHLLEPLGIVCRGWQQDAQGYYFGGNNVDYTPRDIARLGHLYLRGGQLAGRQIVPQDWVDRSLRDYVRSSGWEWGVLREIGYGWLWWLGEINQYEVYTALGYGGQFVLCVPELDMIVVSASYSDLWYDQADQQEREVLEIVAEHILPAVIDERCQVEKD
jgi:CubicO group peptidase (beta-lactamase class C family)